MFSIKKLRPGFTNEIHIDSDSLSGVFGMVKKEPKMAILATWELGLNHQVWVNSVRKMCHQISYTGSSPGRKAIVSCIFPKMTEEQANFETFSTVQTYAITFIVTHQTYLIECESFNPGVRNG